MLNSRRVDASTCNEIIIFGRFSFLNMFSHSPVLISSVVCSTTQPFEHEICALARLGPAVNDDAAMSDMAFV